MLAFRRQRQVDYCEFQDRLVYTVNSRPSRAPPRDPVSKNRQTKKPNKCSLRDGHGLENDQEREDIAMDIVRNCFY